MIRHEPAFPLHGGVERGDVGEADDRFGRARQRVVVDTAKDAHHPVAAAQTPDRLDLGISQRTIDVDEPLAILSGEISKALRRMRPDDRLPAERARVVLSAWEVFGFLQWTGWSNERDVRSGRERRRASEVLYGHKSSSWRELRSEFGDCMFQIWHMHCFSRAW